MYFFIFLLLTGCWDERLLRDYRTVYLSGIDLDEEDNYLTTAIIRDMNISESSRGEISISDELVIGKGESIREAGMAIDRSVAGDFDPAKGRVVILGNEVAQENIYNVLDSIYRDPRMNINAKLIVTDGAANEIITHLQENEVEKGEYLYEMIKSSENHSENQNMTLRTIRTYLFDEGRDFTLPYLGIDEDYSEVTMQGAALFKGGRFTGEYLSPDEMTLLLFFKEKRALDAILTEELEEEEVISFNVKNVSRELEIENKHGAHVIITLRLDLEVLEYPPDHLDEQETIDYLNKQLAKLLTEKAKRVFEKLASNQSDVLGLGRELMAYHPTIWKEIEGKDYYEHILVTPKIEVNVKSGRVIF